VSTTLWLQKNLAAILEQDIRSRFEQQIISGNSSRRLSSTTAPAARPEGPARPRGFGILEDIRVGVAKLLKIFPAGLGRFAPLRGDPTEVI